MKIWESTKPIMITHWDPDLYPTASPPGIQELVIYGITSAILRGRANVLLKEVDLLLNPKVRAAFRDDAVVGQFVSLLNTGLFKVLLPTLSTDFGDIDPTLQPMTAVAWERERKRRPYKNKFRQLTREDEIYCGKLDKILVNAGTETSKRPDGVVRFRKEFPRTNEFACVLTGVLSRADRAWLSRPQFRGITPKMADDFVTYCNNPSKAVDRLPPEVKPNSREAYRSLFYQVADCAEYKSKHNNMTGSRAMKNLLQSVYAYCELNREDASGTYEGLRIAELPLIGEPATDDLPTINEALLLNRTIELPVASNIGSILTRVLEEIPREPVDINANYGAFVDRCAHLSDAFAKYSVDVKPVVWSPTAQHRWTTYRHRVQIGAFLLSLLSHTVGLQFISSFEAQEVIRWSPDTIHGLTYCAQPLVNLIRGGKAYADRDTERARVSRALFETMKSRVSHIA